MRKRVALHDGERDWSVEIGEDQLTVDGIADPFDIHWVGDGRFEMRDGERVTMAASARAGAAVWVTLEGEVFEFHLGLRSDAAASVAQDADLLAPPMSATVVRVAVEPGARVKTGDLLVALEAMKMELPIRAPRDGVVTAVHCKENDRVQPGRVLVEMD